MAGATGRGRLPAVVGPAGVTFLSILSFTFVLALYPQLQAVYGFTTFMIAMAAALSALPQVLLGPFMGVALDRYGRKAVLIPCLGIWLLGAGVQILGLSTGQAVYPLFLAGRILQAVADAGFFPVALALVGDRYHESPRLPRMMALLESAASVGGIVGPVLTAAVLRVGIWAPSAATGVFGLLLTFFLVRSLPGGRPHPAASAALPLRRQVATAWPAVRSPLVLGGFLMGFLSLYALEGVQTFLGLLVRDRYGLGSGAQGILLSVVPWAMLLGAQLVPGLLKRHSWFRLSVLALATGVAAFFVLTVPMPWPALAAWLALVGVGMGGILPLSNSHLAGQGTPAVRGMIMSLYGSARLFGALVAPLLLGALLPFGYSHTYVVGGGIGAVISLVAVALVREARRTVTV